jgi:predicted 3-demethylubiquinone-9 3-methyltransferase (glyoxalase superfamily)
MIMSQITPFLWFDGDVEEAMNFYLSVFKDAQVESVHRPGPGKPARQMRSCRRC